jgi:hypothetical protein
MNGPTATKATKAARIPMAEPWAGHENLDPTAVAPNKTKAVAAPTAPAPPAMFEKYTTTTDTFAKELPPGGEEDQAEEESET